MYVVSDSYSVSSNKVRHVQRFLMLVNKSERAAPFHKKKMCFLHNIEKLCNFTLGRIGLKFDIFELMFYEILVMHIHNSQLVYNFYEQAIKLFL